MSETETPNKVVTLFGGDTSHLSGEPNEEVARVLTEALEMAKAGELLAVSISGPLRCGSLLTLDAGAGQGTAWTLLAAMEVALFNYKLAVQMSGQVSHA